MIEPQTLAIIFLIAGAIMIMAEAMSPGVFIIIPGTVLLILGLIGLIYPDFLFSEYAPILALATALPVTLGTIKLYQKLAKPEPPTTVISESLIGKEGIVTVSTEPNSIKGKVKIGSHVWSARSSEPIEAGTEVEVIGGEGVHVTVSRK